MQNRVHGVPPDLAVQVGQLRHPDHCEQAARRRIFALERLIDDVQEMAAVEHPGDRVVLGLNAQGFEPRTLLGQHAADP